MTHIITSKEKKTRKISRRNVLIGAGAVPGAGALGVGGYNGFGLDRRFLRDETAVIPEHRVMLSGGPKLVIARGASPAANVHAAIEKMGGMTRFVGARDVVLVKPNIGWLRTLVADSGPWGQYPPCHRGAGGQGMSGRECKGGVSL